jgi:hypothetical protein
MTKFIQQSQIYFSWAFERNPHAHCALHSYECKMLSELGQILVQGGDIATMVIHSWKLSNGINGDNGANHLWNASRSKLSSQVLMNHYLLAPMVLLHWCHCHQKIAIVTIFTIDTIGANVSIWSSWSPMDQYWCHWIANGLPMSPMLPLEFNSDPDHHIAI